MSKSNVLFMLLCLIGCIYVQGSPQEGMNETCAREKCAVEGFNCVIDTDCANAVTVALAGCTNDANLSDLVSTCDPVPVNTSQLVRAQCTNLATYQFKENAQLKALTSCAQDNGCLIGFGVNYTQCDSFWGNVPASWFTQAADWSANFDKLTKLKYYVKMGLHWGWDCVNSQSFKFFRDPVTRNMNATYMVNIKNNVSKKKLKQRFAFMAALKGHSPAVWAMSFEPYNFTHDGASNSVYREVMSTAGVRERDPFVVLEPYFESPAKKYPTFVFVMMGVNLGPDPLVSIGQPGGYVLSTKPTLKRTDPKLAAALDAFRAKFVTKDGKAISFDKWCFIEK